MFFIRFSNNISKLQKITTKDLTLKNTKIKDACHNNTKNVHLCKLLENYTNFMQNVEVKGGVKSGWNFQKKGE